MTTVTLDFDQDLYQQLSAEAARSHKAPETLVKEWVVDRLAAKPATPREQTRQVLLKAGLLAAPTAQMQTVAHQATMTLDQVREALDRTEGKPLSEIVIEQRGPK